MVDSWRTYEGVRIPVLELGEIGKALPQWLIRGDSVVAAGVLEELERFLSSSEVDEVSARGYVIELLVEARDWLNSEVDEGVDIRNIKTQIEDLMGEQTKRIWDLLVS
jgi:hypothetical protein